MKENITFDIELEVVGNPIVTIFVDSIPMAGTKFNIELPFGKHELSIQHSGKTNHVPEQFVKIKSVIIDGVDIQDILYTDSINTPEYPEPWASQQVEPLEPHVIGQTELAFNCVWKLPFTSPFYEFVMNHVR